MELLVCSHRGPVTYRRAGAGRRVHPVGPGGLVAVMAPALHDAGGTWLFAPSSDEDRAAAAEGVSLSDGRVTYRPVDLPPDAHDAHYRVVSSALLFPLFHSLLPLAVEPTFTAASRRAWAGYRLVNQRYGEAIRRHGRGPVLVEDLHLILAAAAAGDGAHRPVAYFHHVPWCDPGWFGVLPADLRVELLAGMVAFDTVGFHARRWADAFLACCERDLPGADITPDRVRWREREVAVVVAPAAIDPAGLRATAASARTGAWRERLVEATGGRRLVVRVERADPAKNSVRGIEAWEAVLERRPDLAAEACLLAVLTPVRGWIPAYRDQVDACRAVAHRIDARFPGSVVLHLDADPAGDHHRAVAALSAADVLAVTPLADGLNIVALEGAVVGAPSLVVSEHAGVVPLVAPWATTVNPFDVESTAAAVEGALDEPAGERHRRAAALRRVATARTPPDWVADRLAPVVPGGGRPD